MYAPAGAPPACGNPAFACAARVGRVGEGKTDRSFRQHAAPPGERFLSHTTTPHRTKHVFSLSLSLSLSLSRPPPRRLDFLDSTHPWVFAAHDVDALPPPHDAAVLAHLLHRGPDLHRAHARARLHSDFSRSHCLPPPVPPLAALVSPRKTFNFPNRKNFEYESVAVFAGNRSTGGCRGRGGRGTSLGANKTESFARPDPLRSFL